MGLKKKGGGGVSNSRPPFIVNTKKKEGIWIWLKLYFLFIFYILDVLDIIFIEYLPKFLKSCSMGTLKTRNEDENELWFLEAFVWVSAIMTRWLPCWGVRITIQPQEVIILLSLLKLGETKPQNDIWINILLYLRLESFINSLSLIIVSDISTLYYYINFS